MAALAAWRRHPFRGGRLRWDGQGWWFRPDDGSHERAGHLDLMFDFGNRMLLRFVFNPEDAGPRRAHPAAWLPVGRLPSHEAVALRAAVYCRRLNPDLSPRREREPR
jgi:hypothetical protein